MNVIELLSAIHKSVPFKVRAHVAMDDHGRIVVRMRATVNNKEYGHEQTLHKIESRWSKEIDYNGRSFRKYIERKVKGWSHNPDTGESCPPFTDKQKNAMRQAFGLNP